MLVLTHHVFLVLGFFLAFLLFSRLLVERRSSGSTLAWMLVILFVPYVGIPLYLMLGGRKMRRMMSQKHALYGADGDAEPATGHLAERILAGAGAPPAVAGNRIEWLVTGEHAYARLIELVEGATRTLDVATFILGRDEVGNEVVERLAEKAARGVQVRLLLDALGCFHADRARLQRFEARGGKLAWFMPMLHVPFRGRANLRNHRKLVVADANRALVGGMNLALEYMGPTPLASRWKDLSLVLSGPSVRAVDDIFRSDWCFASGETLPEAPRAEAQAPGAARVQVVGSGPDAEGDPLYDAYLTEVFRAEKRIWIATPYFVPDDALARGLELAARRGVDVRVLVPRRSNHWLADEARGTSLRPLEKAGATILLYEPGMLHAKATLFDDDCAVVASANLDMRSLFLNYEIAVFLYSPPEVKELETWFTTLAHSATRGMPAVSHGRDLLEGAARLLSPLL